MILHLLIKCEFKDLQSEDVESTNNFLTSFYGFFPIFKVYKSNQICIPSLLKNKRDFFTYEIRCNSWKFKLIIT